MVQMEQIMRKDQGYQMATVGYAELPDFVNYPAVERLLSDQGLGFKKEVVDHDLSKLRPFGNNGSDPFFIAFYR